MDTLVCQQKKNREITFVMMTRMSSIVTKYSPENSKRKSYVVYACFQETKWIDKQTKNTHNGTTVKF